MQIARRVVIWRCELSSFTFGDFSTETEIEDGKKNDKTKKMYNIKKIYLIQVLMNKSENI